jgi:2,4-dienoyl-CoA reductase (NADPH2)
MSGRMKRWGVKIKTGRSLTPAAVKRAKPEVLVVATGARPVDLKVPGLDKPHVVQAWDVLMERVPRIGKNVVIVGGNATGCETAHFLTGMGAADPAIFTFLMYHTAERPETARELLCHAGRTITVIEMADRIAANVGRTGRWSLLKSLKLMGVGLMTGTRLLEVTDDAVIVEAGKGREAIPADTVILAVGARSVNDLARKVQGGEIQVVTIGDAREPRKIPEAVREGFEAALKL